MEFVEESKDWAMHSAGAALTGSNTSSYVWSYKVMEWTAPKFRVSLLVDLGRQVGMFKQKDYDSPR